jgi:hypothetical protein
LIGIFLTSRKSWKRVLLITLIFATSLLAFKGVESAVRKPSSINSAEAMSVPIQMVGALMNNSHANLDSNERNYFLSLQPKWNYSPTNADPVKNPLRYSPDFDSKRFLETTFEACLKNKRICIEAYTSHFASYFNPWADDFPIVIESKNGWTAIPAVYSSGWGYRTIDKKLINLNTQNYSDWQEYYETSISADVSYEGFRGYIYPDIWSQETGRPGGYAYSINPDLGQFLMDNILIRYGWEDGIWIWLALFCGGIFLALKKYRNLIIVSMVLVAYALLFATAPIAYFRYLMPIVFLTPLILTVSLQEINQAWSERSLKLSAPRHAARG